MRERWDIKFRVVGLTRVQKRAVWRKTRSLRIKAWLDRHDRQIVGWGGVGLVVGAVLDAVGRKWGWEGIGWVAVGVGASVVLGTWWWIGGQSDG